MISKRGAFHKFACQFSSRILLICLISFGLIGIAGYESVPDAQLQDCEMAGGQGIRFLAGKG
jgi:hypothetical protein